MKIELKKETRVNGDVFYCIYKDDNHHSSSVSEEKARMDYDALLSGKKDVVETLESKEI